MTNGLKGAYDVYKGPKNPDPAVISGAQWPVNEPLAVVPAMAAATKNLGFGVTVATTYEQPYHLARRLSTVDHLTGGRLGWNVVTGYLDSAARNLGHTDQLAHDERYAVAEEYMQVMYKLWYAIKLPHSSIYRSIFQAADLFRGNLRGATMQSSWTGRK